MISSTREMVSVVMRLPAAAPLAKLTASVPTAGTSMLAFSVTPPAVISIW